MEKLRPTFNLASAIAISGAAASPNAGKHVPRLIGFVLALINARLNYWLPNPAYYLDVTRKQTAKNRNLPIFEVSNKWLADRIPHWLTAPARKPNLIYLLKEIFGRNSTTGALVNLSDGGHVENMGIFQLLRRKCKFIIVVDGSQDFGLTFDGFSEALRIAQIDLGVSIDMEGLDEIRSGDQAHAVGNIFYGIDDGGNEVMGRLIYLKSTMVGDRALKGSLGEPAFYSSPRRDDSQMYDAFTYVSAYAQQHPDFPHESTADQIFDEEQFEAYRALGYNVAMSALSAKH